MFDIEQETDHTDYLEASAECGRGGFLIYLEGVVLPAAPANPLGSLNPYAAM